MIDQNSTVIYQKIPSLHPDFYRAGSDGSIWSCQKCGKGAGKIGKWKKLRHSIAGRGYHAVHVSFGKIKQKRYIHRLVLEAFVGPCPAGMECLHQDGDKSNNRIGNLRWGTSQENADDVLRQGRRKFGSQLPHSVLTEEFVREVRKRHSEGESCGLLAKEYQIHPETLRSALGGSNWKHVR